MHSLPHQINVVQRRNDGQKESRPQKADAGHRNPSDMVELPQHHENNRRDLSKRVGFAENAGAKIAQSRDGVEHRAHREDANVAAENHDGELPRNLMHDGEHQERRAEQHLVGNRIEILTEQCLLVKRTRQQSVQPVAEPGEQKQNERTAVVSLDQLYHHEGKERHAHQGELIGRSENLRQP